MRANSNIPLLPSLNTHGSYGFTPQNHKTSEYQESGHQDFDNQPQRYQNLEHKSLDHKPLKHQSLDKKEIKLIAVALIQSAALLAGMTAILAYLIASIKAGSLIAPLCDGSWFTFLLDQCTLPAQWWCAPLVMIGIYLAVNLIAALIYPNYKRDELELRQGLNGELIFLPLPLLLTLVPLTNVFEETTFRGCLIPLLAMGCAALSISPLFTALIAVAGSTLLFWLVHWQYRNKLSVVMTLVGGATLGTIYVISHSVLVCIITHIVYNWFVLYFEHMIACSDPNYFGGKQPTHYVGDLLSK